MRELIDAFDAADADDDVRAIIVTGAGRAFCAGADLSAGAARSSARTATGRAAVHGGRRRRVGLSRCGARRRRARHAAHLRMPQAGDRGDERPGGRHRRHHAAADGRAHRRHEARFGFVFSRRGIVPEAARAGSCRASSASRRRSNGVTRAACSAPTRRCGAGWSAAWSRRTTCCRRHARSRASIATRPRRSRSR